MRLLLALTCAMVLVDTVFYAALVPYSAEKFGLSKPSVGSGSQWGSGALSWVSAFTWLVTRAPEERRGR